MRVFFHKAVRLLFMASLGLAAAILWSGRGFCLSYGVEVRPDQDALTIGFQGNVPNVEVRRTGVQAVTISVPQNVWDAEPRPEKVTVAGARLISDVKLTTRGLRVYLNTPAFGFLSMPSDGRTMRVVFFRDPIGAKWGTKEIAPPPPAPRPKAEPEAKQESGKSAAAKESAPEAAPDVSPETASGIPADSVQEAASRTPAPETDAARSAAPAPEPGAAAAGTPAEQASPATAGTEAPAGEPQADQPQPPASSEVAQASQKGAQAAQEGMTPPQEPPGQVTLDLFGGTSGRQPPPGKTGGSGFSGVQSQESASRDSAMKRPFFSVPYALRAEVRDIGPDEAVPMSTVDMAGQPLGQSADRLSVQGPEGASGAGAYGPALQPVGGTGEGESRFHLGEGGDVQGQVVGQVAGQDTDQVMGQVTGQVEGQVSGQVSGPVSGPVSEQAQLQTLDDLEPLATPVAAANESIGQVLEGQDKALAGGEDGVAPKIEIEGNASGFEDLAALAEEEPKIPGETSHIPPEMMQQYQDLLSEAQADMAAGDFFTAMGKLEQLRALPHMPVKFREDVLYTLADTYSNVYKDDLKNFEKIQSAYIAAMNANPASRRVPNALINLGLVNLKMGNIPEARAYFNLLKTKYPHDMNIPYISYYWGDYYFKKGDWRKAADNFQYLVQVYPDNKLVRDAALGLAQSLEKLGYYKQAYQILDYVDKRWPRFYVDYPPFLKMYADISNMLEKYDQAKNYYWTYYNMEPDADGNDVVLARLGDIYLNLGKKEAARELYEKAATTWPSKEGGLVAKMRLAEEGIYDEPTMDQMAVVFDRPFNLRPQQIYTQIVEKFPDSPLAPLAQLKLAMWYMFNKRYSDSLKAVQDFLAMYPKSKLVDRARDLGLQVFTKAVPELLKEENYGRIVNYWQKYGDLFSNSTLSGDTRMAVAQSFWKRGEPGKALDLIEMYLQNKQVPKYSEMAMDMALVIHLDQHAWSDVVDLASMAESDWKITPERQKQLDYARALAYENLGEQDKSLPLWAKLAEDQELDRGARAYAMYYMAKNYQKAQDFRNVFVYSQEALGLFLESGGERAKIKDCILMTIYAAENSGRYREALKWANKYDTYIPESDPEWASSRFRLAKLFRKNGSEGEWESLMKEIAEKKPDSLYGRMAASALEANSIEQAAEQFDTGLN